MVLERDGEEADRAELVAEVMEARRTISALRERIADFETIIADQQRAIATLEAGMARLREQLQGFEARPGSGGPSGMPGNKPTPTSPKPPKMPRKRRTHSFTRARSTPTETVIHAVDQCPNCETGLLGGWVKRTREVIELPKTPVVVTAHQFLERECPVCRIRVTPTDALVGVVAGKQRFGIGLVSHIVMLREDARLPFRGIQRLLATCYGLAVSVGSLVAAAARVATAGAAEMAAILERIRNSPVVFADETGWREDGVNGYVWTLSTLTERFFFRGRRTRAQIEELLGPTFTGVLVTDFYAAYDHYAGLHQRCWAHLLREIHDLVVANPTAGRLGRWARAVHRIFRIATTFSSPIDAERLAMQDRCEQRLMHLGRRFVNDPTAVHRKLCRRIEKYLAELFVFVAMPEVPPTNNAAERSLRPLVIARKMSGGTRSNAGSTTKMTLATLFGTWRLDERNLIDACRSLLSLPHPTPPSLAPT